MRSLFLSLVIVFPSFLHCIQFNTATEWKTAIMAMPFERLTSYDRYGQTPLIRGICVKKPVRLYSTLMEVLNVFPQQINVNQPDIYYIPPIVHALAMGRPHIVKLLLDHGARVNNLWLLESILATTMKAIEKNNYNTCVVSDYRMCVHMLIKAGAFVEESGLDGQKLLDLVVKTHSDELVEPLINAGAIPEVSELILKDYAQSDAHKIVLAAAQKLKKKNEAVTQLFLNLRSQKSPNYLRSLPLEVMELVTRFTRITTAEKL